MTDTNSLSLDNPSSPLMVEAVARALIDAHDAMQANSTRRALPAYNAGAGPAVTYWEGLAKTAILASLPQEGDAAKLKVLEEALKQICGHVREAIDDGNLDAIVALDAIDSVACAALAQSGDRQK